MLVLCYILSIFIQSKFINETTCTMRLKGNCIILSDSNVCSNRLLNILLSLQRTTTEEATISLSGGVAGIFCSDSSSFGRRSCFPSNFNKNKRQTEILNFSQSRLQTKYICTCNTLSFSPSIRKWQVPNVIRHFNEQTNYKNNVFYNIVLS